jgi:hypothetical protein
LEDYVPGKGKASLDLGRYTYTKGYSGAVKFHSVLTEVLSIKNHQTPLEMDDLASEQVPSLL